MYSGQTVNVTESSEALPGLEVFFKHRDRENTEVHRVFPVLLRAFVSPWFIPFRLKRNTILKHEDTKTRRHGVIPVFLCATVSPWFIPLRLKRNKIG